jgi:hypothetical protein
MHEIIRQSKLRCGKQDVFAALFAENIEETLVPLQFLDWGKSEVLIIIFCRLLSLNWVSW